MIINSEWINKDFKQKYYLFCNFCDYNLQMSNLISKFAENK